MIGYTKVLQIDWGDENYGYYHQQRRDMLRFIPDNISKVLDVGCAAGEFGRILKSEKKVEIWGIELYEKAASEAQLKLDRVIVADVESGNLDLPQHYFVCIVCNDILEHLKDPWNVLRTFHGYLRNEGYVVASIPNIRYYDVIAELIFRKEWRYIEEGILDKTHLRFFTIKSVKELFEDCGYHVEGVEGINTKKCRWYL